MCVLVGHAAMSQPTIKVRLPVRTITDRKIVVTLASGTKPNAPKMVNHRLLATRIKAMIMQNGDAANKHLILLYWYVFSTFESCDFPWIIGYSMFLLYHCLQVNALVVTWFTSRQHCLNHRYKKDWDKDTYWLSLKNACPFHAKPVGISTVQCAQHVPVCIEPANRLGAADVQRFYRPVPINNDHSTSSSGVKQIPAKKSVAVQVSFY